MITEEIEKALIRGDAKLKTFMLATSAVGTIQVPANNFIIITSITAFPFSDVVGNLGINKPASKTYIDSRSTHVVELINQSSDRVGFVYRNQWEYRYAKNETYVKNSEPITWDTNIVRTSDVFIQIGTYTGLSNGNIATYLPVTWNTQNNSNPVSYGNTTSNYWQIIDPSFLWLYVPSLDQQVQLINFPGLINQPFPYYSGEDGLYGRLNDVTGNTAPNNRTPIVQVQYVQMNQISMKNFNQS